MQFNVLTNLLEYTVWRESLEGRKFGKLTLFEHLMKESLAN